MLIFYGSICWGPSFDGWPNPQHRAKETVEPLAGQTEEPPFKSGNSHAKPNENGNSRRVFKHEIDK